MESNLESISLRKWIKAAVDSIGRFNGGIPRDLSSAYLTASLTIAISLSEQVSQAESFAELGVPSELALLPIGADSDWAEFVMICLNRTSHDAPQKSPDRHDNYAQEVSWEEYELLNQPMPHETGTNDSISVADWDEDNARGVDEQLITFLTAFEADESEAGEAAAHTHPEAYSQSPVSRAADAQPEFSRVVTSEGESVDYLNVHSAYIRCPKSDKSSTFNRDTDASSNKLQRIFSVGLVFYELFSRGEVPPPDLVALASSDRAFLSLPNWTLTESGVPDEVMQSDLKRRRGPAGASKDVGLCQLAFEYLKLMGLPGPLCNLILNMLDCVYGDFSGTECYTKMVDVISDLNLMKDKPDKFLRDLDLEILSMRGLDLGDTVFSREDKLASIEACYRRSVSESYELAIITGESGTGKSWLARRVGTFVAGQGGLFLSGKFDQMKQVTPFSALASAFDQYCDVLIREKESNWAKQAIYKLNVALGRDSCHLIKVIPKLKHILSCPMGFADSSSGQSSVNAMQRLNYLICQFVEVISTSSVVSVTLFLDDVQWADAASILVLNQLLAKRHNKFFFLACCRSMEVEDDHLFRDMIDNVHALGIKTTVIELSCLEKHALNQMVSDLLCLPPRIVRSLSEIIYTKTKGNPLFFAQLLLSLNRDGLLRLSLSRQRWVWDEEEIQSMKIPDDVALCFTNGISKLPIEVQSALRTLSMFGASSKCSYIEALESHLNLKLIKPLKVAMSEGLVNERRGSLHFCHDRIQEASYAMIENNDRCRDHLMFGLCLVKLSLDTGDNEMLFTAVNQINFGGPAAVSDKQEYTTMARYNLLAGNIAMGMSDFSSAYSFFAFGIEFLPPGHWKNHYQLSLELFELASKSTLAIGNIQRLPILSSEVMDNARCFEDELNTHFIIMSSLSYASKIPEALEKGNRILSRLGEDIPINPSQDALDEQIQQTQSLIRGISESDILNYKLMTDNIKLEAMKFLAHLESITVMIKPSVHPFVTLKMVQLTMLYGLSPVSPIGFVYFGSLLANRGSIRLGHRFTLLAKDLLEKLEAGEVAGEVICVATEVVRFIEPLQAAIESLAIQGESAAMAGGDIRWACINRLQYCTMMFWACPSLSVVYDKFCEASRFMKEQHHRASLSFMLPFQETTLILMGCETKAVTEDELSSSSHESRSPRHVMLLFFHKLYRSFMLENHSMLKEYAEILPEHFNFIVRHVIHCG
eukprot:CCRYP_003834-RA/>CCRYP_003834-RA protein AED:0.03 eAED:0.03 QI:51/1/1/1/0.66/0.5/4/541/1215